MNPKQQDIDFLPKQPHNQPRQVPSYLEAQFICQLCTDQYDLAERVPMMLCQSQHNCCLLCVKEIIIRKNQCPFCRTSISLDKIKKNRMLCRILEELVRKKGQEIKINERPQKQFEVLRRSFQQQPVIVNQIQNNIPPEVDLFENNNQPYNDSIILDATNLNDYRQLVNNQQDGNNQPFLKKILKRIQLSEPFYCIASFLVMFYSVPFTICELVYAVDFEQQVCLDTDYGIGMTLRSWMLSSAIIGLSMFGLQFMVMVWKICMPARKKIPKMITIFNIICFILKFLGYNLLGLVVFGNIDQQGQSQCSDSVQSYMEALFIIQIVVICGLCSICDRRR